MEGFLILPVSRAALALMAGLAMAVNGSATAAEYRRIPVQLGEPAVPELAERIAKLRDAMKSGDVNFVLHSVADDFQCVRDFGGMCNESMTVHEKFAAAVRLKQVAGNTNFGLMEQLLNARFFARTTALGELKSPLLCAPAVPRFDEEHLARVDTELFKGGDATYWFTWVAIEGNDISAYAKPDRSSPRMGTLSRELVHLDHVAQDGWLSIDLTTGKKAYVRSEDVTVLLPAQLCYTRNTIGWQISAFVGGGD
jgi:hypothetical protein